MVSQPSPDEALLREAMWLYHVPIHVPTDHVLGPAHLYTVALLMLISLSPFCRGLFSPTKIFLNYFLTAAESIKVQKNEPGTKSMTSILVSLSPA